MTTVKTSVTVTNGSIEVTENKSFKDMVALVIELQKEIEKLKTELDKLRNGTDNSK